jgi:hypothetical protein
VEAAYLAGILDGEGTVTMTVQTSRGVPIIQPLVSISNTCGPLLEYAKAKLGNNGWASSLNQRTKRGGFSEAPVQILHMQGFRCYPVLKALRPHLHVKALQADLVTTLIERRLRKPFGASWDATDLALVNDVRGLNIAWSRLSPSERATREAAWFSTFKRRATTSSPMGS